MINLKFAITLIVYVCMCEPQDAESKPQCRRLQLKDIIPTEMQRLTKYPLLLENIAKNTGMCVYVCQKLIFCTLCHVCLIFVHSETRVMSAEEI